MGLSIRIPVAQDPFALFHTKFGNTNLEGLTKANKLLPEIPFVAEVTK